MNTKTKYTLAITILILISAISYFALSNYNLKSKITNILTITSPTHAITGTIKEIDGDTVSLNLENSTSTDLYKIKINEDTSFYQPTLYVNYLLSERVAINPQSSDINNLVIGQKIIVNSTNDIRLLSPSQILASSITTPLMINGITGQIMSINQSELILTATPPTLPSNASAIETSDTQSEKKYTVKIDSNTEISLQSVDTNYRPIFYKLSDLKIGQDVLVYSLEDVVDSTDLTALRIEPIISSPSPSTP
jgi:hypothetical protein